jgi:hypothetical protein
MRTYTFVVVFEVGGDLSWATFVCLTPIVCSNGTRMVVNCFVKQNIQANFV